jgi:protein O-GlcNAc transferase
MSKFEEAVALHKSGQLDKALLIYNEIIYNIKDCNAYHNIAVIYIQKKNLLLAEIYAYYAIAFGGKESYFFITYAKILNLTKSFKYLEKIKNKYNIKIENDNFNKLNNNILKINKPKKINDKEYIELKNKIIKLLNNNKLDEALQLISSSKWNEKLLGKQLKAELYVKSKKLKNAVNEYLSILKVEEENFHALSALGALFLSANNISLADFYLTKALKVNSGDYSVLSNLASTYKIKGLYDEALTYLLKAKEIDPENPTLLANIGSCFAQMEKNKYAEYLFIKSLDLDLDNYVALTNYASLKYNVELFEEAIDLFKKSLSIKETAETYNNLGLLYSNALDSDQALVNYNKAVVINSLYQPARTNKLFLLNYIDIKPSDLISEYYSYWRSVPAPISLPINQNKNNKKIRIGFISGDFNAHPVFNFLYPLLKYIDKNLFEIIIYSNGTKIDSITKIYKNLANSWRDIKPLSDADLAKLIYSENIDLLIDLAGHTGSNRLNVFRYKPAFKSATWIGYNYSTGLTEIDYFITDIHQVPVNSEKYYSEKILRLPSTVCSFMPDVEKLKDINEPPVLKNNYIIFASFSRVIRMNDLVISTWSSILLKVPNSKLRINSRGVNKNYLQKIILNKFLNYGISSNRLILEFGDLSLGLNSSDIILDSFPHNSGTTLYESIYMGCPIITLKSEISLGRLAYSILKNIDLDEFAANTIDEYINIAVNLASNYEKLKFLRNNLRIKLEKSDIMNHSKFALQFQNAVKTILAK